MGVDKKKTLGLKKSWLVLGYRSNFTVFFLLKTESTLQASVVERDGSPSRTSEVPLLLHRLQCGPFHEELDQLVPDLLLVHLLWGHAGRAGPHAWRDNGGDVTSSVLTVVEE